jgi:hypothetical protein
VDRNGPDALRNLPPIAVRVSLVDGADPESDAALTERCVIVEPVVHPLVEAQLDQVAARPHGGLTRRGRFTWSVGLGERTNTAGLSALFNAVEGFSVFVEDQAVTNSGGPAKLSAVSPWTRAQAVGRLLNGTPCRGILTQALRNQLGGRPYPRNGVPAYGAVTLTADDNNLWVKVVTNEPEEPYTTFDPKILNLRPAGRQVRDPRPMRAVDAIAVCEAVVSHGFTLVDGSEDKAFSRLRRRLAAMVVACPAPGRPALAQVSVGNTINGVWDAVGVQPVTGGAFSTAVLTAGDLVKVLDAVGDNPCFVDPSAADVAAMAAAGPVDDDRLKPYQREVVGLHLSTRFGFVNTLATGMGKTVTTLDAMRRRAAGTGRYRGLVICEAVARSQWADEAAVWFPEALVVNVASRADTDTLVEALDHDGPVLVVTSYALASLAADADPGAVADGPAAAEAAPVGQLTLFNLDGTTETVDLTALVASVAGTPAGYEVAGNGQDTGDTGESTPLGVALVTTFWHDVAADEANPLRTPGIKTSRALWRIRLNAEVAVALTATPIGRSLDDLGRLIAWTRKDPEMFTGHRLDKVFDLSFTDGATSDLAEFHRATHPLVFRRDKSEAADEMPDLDAAAVRLEPTVAEKALAKAAEHELRRVFDELVALLHLKEKAGDDRTEIAKIADDLQAARGAVLGGTTLARMAASDPSALLGSGSAGAALLAAQGLIAAACSDGLTKRRWAVEVCTRRVADGGRVLLFTSFRSVADNLVPELREAGLRVGAVLGGGGRTRDRAIAAFRDGELDVLVSTASGEKGLNLQVATTLIHYDLPWTPEGVLQRTGRVERLGSENDTVEVLFPVMAGTVEERVAGLVVARAMTSMQALDGVRGVDAKDTDLGRSLGTLAASVDTSALSNKRDIALLELTRRVLAAS